MRESALCLTRGSYYRRRPYDRPTAREDKQAAHSGAHTRRPTYTSSETEALRTLGESLLATRSALNRGLRDAEAHVARLRERVEGDGEAVSGRDFALLLQFTLEAQEVFYKLYWTQIDLLVEQRGWSALKDVARFTGGDGAPESVEALHGRRKRTMEWLELDSEELLAQLVWPGATIDDETSPDSDEGVG